MVKHRRNLNIQVDDFEGVFLDEFAARFDVFAHERGENILGGDGILEFDLEQRAGIRIHGGIPKLLGIHFAQAFETRDGEIFFGVFDDVVEHVHHVGFGDLVSVARDGERRMIEFFDLPGEPAQMLIFGGGSDGPIDFLAVRRPELNFVKAVLFVEGDFAFEFQF